MPSAPNIVVAGGGYELTYRTEEGLPLVPSRTMEKICRSYLVAAATLYKVRPTSVKVMGNHVHKKVIVDRTVYFYLNAARANLVEPIDEYPGFSTWQNGFEETF